MIDRLLEEEFVICKTKWYEELTKMRETKQKAEIQALNYFGIDYLTNISAMSGVWYLLNIYFNIFNKQVSKLGLRLTSPTDSSIHTHRTLEKINGEKNPSGCIEDQWRSTLETRTEETQGFHTSVKRNSSAYGLVQLLSPPLLGPFPTCGTSLTDSKEGFDEYENIDFVVDKDENDENRVNNDDERQKKKKRNKRKYKNGTFGNRITNRKMKSYSNDVNTHNGKYNHGVQCRDPEEIEPIRTHRRLINPFSSSNSCRRWPHRIPSNVVRIRRNEPTSSEHKVLKPSDIILHFDVDLADCAMEPGYSQGKKREEKYMESKPLSSPILGDSSPSRFKPER
ncbi:hypothetical protein LXL04_025505 [Taraxacum kok-saghyz]